MGTRLAGVVALAGLTAVGVHARQAPTSPSAPDPVPGAVSGVISDAVTGRPIVGAAVYLASNAGPSPYQRIEQTDAKGRFVFADVPPADYSLQASKAGYAVGYFGAPTGGRFGGLIALAEGQWFSLADLALTRYGDITGMVADEHGEPLPGAYVRVIPQVLAAGLPHLAAGVIARTDDRGMYRIGGLKPGAYLVNVPSVQSTVPIGGPDAHDFNLMMGSADPFYVQLDSRTQLAVGNYAIPASSNGRPLVYPQVFFPDSPTIGGASRIDLGPGEERAGVDFRLQPAPAVRVSGRLDGPPEAVAGQVVRLLPAGSEELAAGSEAATSVAASDGTFELANIPPGSYVIQVSRRTSEFDARSDLGNFANARTSLPATPGVSKAVISGGGSPSLWSVLAGGSDTHAGRLAISVGASDLSGLVVPMLRLGSMTGSVAWEGPPPADWGVTTIRIEPALGTPSLGRYQTSAEFDGTTEQFSVGSLLPGRYVLRAANARAGGVMKSVRVNDRDVLDAGLDVGSGDFTGVVVTMTTDVPVLTGTVRNGPADAGVENAVVAFPAEREQWTGYGFTPTRIKVAAVSPGGRYRLDSVPAGDYYVVAVGAAQASGWQDPAWLNAASRVAARVTLRWGTSTTQDLAVASIKP